MLLAKRRPNYYADGLAKVYSSCCLARLILIYYADFYAETLLVNLCFCLHREIRKECMAILVHIFTPISHYIVHIDNDGTRTMAEI